MIRRSSENIAAREVEAVLQGAEQVVEAAVVPVPDETRGEEIKAYLVLESGSDGDEAALAAIIAHCRANLAPFKVPRFFEFRPELPKTASNKIAKHRLIADRPDLRLGSYDRVAVRGSRLREDDPMADTYDAVIVGAGHKRPGLRRLPGPGRSAHPGPRTPSVIGGACVTEEVWPGYRVSTASYVMALLQPKVILDLDLARYGFEVLKPPPMFQPFPDGRSLTFFDEEARTCAEIARFSTKDAAAYPTTAATCRRWPHSCSASSGRRPSTSPPCLPGS